ncbi:MAG: dihydropteroate synthase [Acidimicrobiales bacterium]
MTDPTRSVATPLVMGILNVTPDSFFDGGMYLDHDAAIARGRQMLEEGADIIDVGGESTRPGAAHVEEREELSRVIPVVEVLATECRVSIDTSKQSVARAALAAGAFMVNDVSASLAPVAAEAGAAFVVMHRKGTPGDMQDNPTYDDVVSEICAFLRERAVAAEALGIAEVWIDPGFGFGKTAPHNVEILARLREIVALGYPVLVGTSRKTFLGKIAAGAVSSDVPADPVGDRLQGSIASAVWAMSTGVAAVRAHDVAATAQAARIVGGMG